MCGKVLCVCVYVFARQGESLCLSEVRYGTNQRAPGFNTFLALMSPFQRS
jgi:hypothetical protein